MIYFGRSNDRRECGAFDEKGRMDFCDTILIKNCSGDINSIPLHVFGGWKIFVTEEIKKFHTSVDLSAFSRLFIFVNQGVSIS